MVGRVLRAAYALRFYHSGSWTLQLWGSLLLASLAGVLLLRARFQIVTLNGLVAAVILALVIAGMAVQRWADRRSFVDFEPEPDATRPVGRALDATDKIALRATGQFEVEGKQHFFADLLAYWRTFGTREHGVMAFVHPSRVLLIGQLPAQDIGMWYVFFRPEMIREIVPGRLQFGGHRYAGLRVRYEVPPEASKSRRRVRLLRSRASQSGRLEQLHLAFDDEAARRQVWADLVADGP